MILKVGIFKEGILENLKTAYDPRELDLEFVDLHYLGKVDLKGVAERIKQTVTFRGILTSQIEQVCGRCLERVPRAVSTPFDFTYDVQGRETIDATNDLRDLLILGHPDRFLCSMNCRGICPQCGANLNRETCHCQNQQNQKEASPIQEQLKNIFGKKEK